MGNATLVDSLADVLDRTPVGEEMDPTLQQLGLYSCRNCPTIVYCRTGARALRALRLLDTKAGFTGPLYNGQGTTQWTASGYSLDWGPSTTPPCAKTTDDSFCPRNSVPGGGGDGTGSPTPPPQVNQRKQQDEPKCGSLARTQGLGGAAGQAKDCSRNGDGGRRRRRRLRGM